MDNNFLEQMLAAVQQMELLSHCRCIRAQSGTALPFPVRQPLICFWMEEADRLDYFLGYDEVLVGSEKLCVSVLCEEKMGGAYCEQLAKRVCGTILQADSGKLITSVAVEKCMYDKTNFAYKVIMRLALRESIRPL